jgi:uncharacterized RDD family membrane protein YckC
MAMPPPPPPPPLDEYGSGSGPTSPSGAPLAPPVLRIIARFLDAVILGVINFLVALIVLGPDDAGFSGLGGDADFQKLYLVSVIGVAISFVWDAVLTRMYGGTPMKLAFGLRVVRADNGSQVEWSHAVTRWAIPGAFALVPIPLLSGLVSLVVVVVSLVSIFTKPLRQAVWDQIAKTLVIRPAG